MGALLKVTGVELSSHRVHISLRLDGYSFSISEWYPSINFSRMTEATGELLVRKLLLHAVLFDLQSFMSAGVEAVDITEFGVPSSEALNEVWNKCGHKQWAEWRFRNGLPHFQVPRLVNRNAEKPREERCHSASDGSLLLFSGGKDSLASAILLEQFGREYQTFFVLQSKDGRIDLQRHLIENALNRTRSTRHHETIIFEDYIMAPVESCTEYRFKGVADGFSETLSCMFKGLLVGASINVNTIYLGNEASADEANFFWDAENDNINHQWGKSREAEDLMNCYVHSHVHSSVQFKSLLRDMGDPEIFSIVRSKPEALRQCHSCNRFKPWCARCSKCCYIWLSYCAYLGYDFAISVFNQNLFDIEDNAHMFRELYIGPKPFECVGRKEDVVQAFKMCVKGGIRGKAIDEFIAIFLEANG